jgi:polysaccharide pyruvyl transferase WcaK-like protein
MAMMHVAISRLATLWPHASIRVFTQDPYLLSKFCPKGSPVSASPPWGTSTISLPQWIRPEARRFLFGNDSAPRRLVSLLKRLRTIPLALRSELPAEVLEEIITADVMVVTGMGGITDAFPEFALGLLKRIEAALRCNKLVIMFGHGIGPLQDAELRSLAMAILPYVAFISLREGRSGVPLLRSLGVAPEHIMVTGDDAIEMAVCSQTARVGKSLGVNLRAATYAAVDAPFIAQCGAVLRTVAKTHAVRMVPVPISMVPGEEDANTIRQLMSGSSDPPDAGIDIDSPLMVIGQIKSCRVIFTGSYHAAVFALSSGVPAVCLARSAYYCDKFLGLAEQFGIGCEVVLGTQIDWPTKLTDALERAWRSADEVRPQLFAAANRQVKLSREAYQRAYELVTQR